jgi:HD-like signal output (HDOD) protein
LPSSSILEKIESLPPLPKTIIDIEEFRKKYDKEAADLLKIIEKDALIISTLLKISNSAMFGFRSKVEFIGNQFYYFNSDWWNGTKPFND